VFDWQRLLGDGRMGFGEAVRVCLTKYIDFNGRARRSEYWWFVLFALLVGIATAIVDRVIAPGYVAMHGRGPVSMLASLALLLPSLAVSVRRLHDIDRTGWWILFFYAAVIVLAFIAIGAAFTGHAATAVILLLAILALCVWLIVWFATKGTAGPNRFGADPLAGDATPTASAAPAV
jgi:uncharacterized membrane protein YhaH (DUF805 family)